MSYKHLNETKTGQNKMGHDVEKGTNNVGEIRNDQNVVNIVAYVMRDDLDEMKNAVYRKRSSLRGTSNDSGQTRIFLMRNDKMSNDFDVMKTSVVDWKNDEGESYDNNVAVSEIFCKMSSSSDSPVL